MEQPSDKAADATGMPPQDQNVAATVTIKVRSIALIRTLLGKEQVELSLPRGATIEDVLARLVEIGDPKLGSYLAEPKEKSAHAPLRIMLNGRDITVAQGRQTPVSDGDDILVFVPIAGG